MPSYELTDLWNGEPIRDHDTKVSVSIRGVSDGLEISVLAPYFNDPPPPDAQAEPGNQSRSRARNGLWDFEVVEVFLLNSSSGKYTEVELGPHGHHLVLLLDGQRNCVRHSLDLEYTASIDEATGTWSGRAVLPRSYLPPAVDRFNVYAIHGVDDGDGADDGRVYEALHAVPGPRPDFHRLDHFGRLDVDDDDLGLGVGDELSDVWKKAIGEHVKKQ